MDSSRAASKSCCSAGMSERRGGKKYRQAIALAYFVEGLGAVVDKDCTISNQMLQSGAGQKGNPVGEVAVQALIKVATQLEVHHHRLAILRGCVQGLKLFQINAAAAAQKFGGLVKKFWFFRAHSSPRISVNTGSSSVGLDCEVARVRRSETSAAVGRVRVSSPAMVSRAVRNRGQTGTDSAVDSACS